MSAILPGKICRNVHSLLHHFEVDLLHVHLLVEFWRKLGCLQQLRVHGGRHDYEPRTCNCFDA